MSRGGPDRYRAVVRGDRIQPRHPLDVDEAADANHSFLEEEEQFRAPCVDGGVAAVLSKQVAQLRQRGRPIEREGAKHAQPAAAR